MNEFFADNTKNNVAIEGFRRHLAVRNRYQVDYLVRGVKSRDSRLSSQNKYRNMCNSNQVFEQ